MAEVLFKSILKERGELNEWRVESAGVWAYIGAQATGNAQQAMQERGLDLSQHLSQPTTNDLLAQFDLIVVMTCEQQEALAEQDPSTVRRIDLLRELAGEEGDFVDPVGGTIDTYREAAKELDVLLKRGFSTIKKASS